MILHVFLNLQNQYLMFALLHLRIKLFNRSGVVHLGISDHSLIYATRKLNSVIKGNFQNSVEFRNFRKFNVESFLSDLYMLPWVELDCKKMWMKCGNAGKPYFFKCLTNTHRKDKKD
jgi:hypothetical protein